MEQLSVSFFYASLVAASFSAFLYVANLIGGRLAVRSLAAEGGYTFPVFFFEKLPAWSGRLATRTTLLAIVLVATSMLFRWRAGGYAPYSNMWEFTLALSGSIMLAYIVFERWHRQRALGALALPFAASLLALSAWKFPSTMQPLVPALQNSDVLAAHVGVLILAYGAFSVSFGAAILYLVQGGKRRRFARLPKPGVLDDIAFRSVTLGFPLLSAGIALGAYWANSAWGRYWGWDPKETSILISWLIYGVYLHTHNLSRWRGGRSSAILVVGYGSILFSYFVVNLYVAGLHSYAGV